MCKLRSYITKNLIYKYFLHIKYSLVLHFPRKFINKSYFVAVGMYLGQLEIWARCLSVCRLLQGSRPRIRVVKYFVEFGHGDAASFKCFLKSN